MFRFKKEYANQHIVLANGLLINVANISSEEAQKAFKNLPTLDYMVERVADEPSASTTSPVVKKQKTVKS